MSAITLSKEAFGLEDCKVGETYVLTGNVTAIDGDNVTIEVSSAAYEEEPVEEPVPKKSPISAIGVPGVKKSYA